MSHKLSSMRKRLLEFQIVVNDTEDPPCKVFNCHMKGKCAAERLACDSFYIYTVCALQLSPHTKVTYKHKPQGIRERYGKIQRMEVKMTPYIKPIKKNYEKIFCGSNAKL